MDGNESDEIARSLQQAGEDISYSPADLAARLEQVKAQAGRSTEPSTAPPRSSSGQGESGTDAFGARLLLAVDAVSFSSVDAVTQRRTQEEMARLLDQAARAAGIDRVRWETHEDEGWLLASLPAEVPVSGLLGTFLPYLDADLRDLNRGRTAQARLRLRAAVHFGALAYDACGPTGRAVEKISRLLHHPSLSTAFAEAPEACLAIVLSEAVFDGIVHSSVRSVWADEFRSVLVDQADYGEQAWIQVPGSGAARTAKVHQVEPGKVGAAVRLLRHALGLTLRDAASRAGLSATFLRRVESGRARLGTSSLVRVAKALETTATELLAIAEDRSLVDLVRREAARLEAGLPVPHSDVRPGPNSTVVSGTAGGSYSRQDPGSGESGESRKSVSHADARSSVVRPPVGIVTTAGNEAEGGTDDEPPESRYRVAPGVRLNVRSGPGTSYSIVRVLREGSEVPILCQTPGSTVAGPYGVSKIWDNIAPGEYVSDAYVLTGSDGYIGPRCG